jgi:hypothetical protein
MKGKKQGKEKDRKFNPSTSLDVKSAPISLKYLPEVISGHKAIPMTFYYLRTTK